MFLLLLNPVFHRCLKSVVMTDGTRADYILYNRHGHSLAVLEAKRDSISPADAAEQAKQLGISIQCAVGWGVFGVWGATERKLHLGFRHALASGL